MTLVNQLARYYLNKEWDEVIDLIVKESPMHRGAPRRMKIVLFSREYSEELIKEIEKNILK
ncbi:hypothetical protein [Candidatus Hakubella thermalkaliphila]|nr:hypothetical protein [Candidatus Hakubella thermalkaliphila]